MLLVKTKLGVSGIHGIGLFADEFIPQGTVIWKYHELLDRRLTEGEIKQLAEHSREQIKKYSYREKHSRLYVLCGDDARFFNHSESSNCLDIYREPDQDITVARRDIKFGEELTCDYALFDLDLEEGKYELPTAENFEPESVYLNSA